MSVESSDAEVGVAADTVPEEAPLRRNRDFQALWISRSFATIAKEAADVAYPLLILATTGSAAYAGAVGSVQVFIVGLVSIPAGTLSDRFDRRSLLLVCDLVRLAALGLFTLLVAGHHTNIGYVLATVSVSAVCLGLSNPPALAGIKQLVPPSQLTRATAQNQIRPLGATIVGAPIGSNLFALGQAIPFLGTALMYAISAPLLLFIRRPMQPFAVGREARASRAAEQQDEKNAKKGPGGRLEGVRFILKEPILLAWVVWIMGANAAFGHTGSFLALIAAGRQHGDSDATIGLALSISGCGGLIGAALASWAVRRLPPTAILMGAAWSGVIGAIGLLTVPGVLLKGIVLALVFVRGPIANALFFSYVAVLVPDEMQGRVLGAVMFMAYIGPSFGIFGVGLIFDHFGPNWVFAFMGLLSMVAALPTLSRRILNLPRPDDLAARAAAAQAS